MGESEELTCKERMLKKDGRRFTKYIESNTTHGVLHIFVGKSLIRRLFWAVVVIASAAVCLYNISDRIIYLASSPTSTTISTSRPENGISFPAVTVCNLNFGRRDKLQELSENITNFLDSLSTLDLTDRQDLNSCEYISSNLLNSLEDVTSLEDLAYISRHLPQDFIQACTFMGLPCLDEYFTPTITRFGLCYTFNDGYFTNGTTLRTEGIGVRYGLTMLLNVQQDLYSISDGTSAGVKIDIYDPDVPPEPFERGIAVPTGTNAFIGLRQRQITDSSNSRKCTDPEETVNFNFLNGEFGYSEPACRIDCYYTAIANNCSCVEAPESYPPDTARYEGLRSCTLADSCCAAEQTLAANACECATACNYTVYEKTISYSTFPANYALNETHEDYFSRDNSVAVNVYFETLNIQVETTSDAYGAVALLSDIGGQLGLFLGASVISVVEFLVWLFDEGKDRCCYCTCHRKSEKNDIDLNLESYMKN